MKIIRSFVILLVLLAKIQTTNAQQVKQGFELLEILKIAEVYRQVPNLSFSFAYTYSDSTSPQNVLEQISGSSKIHDGKYWSMLDSVEMLQGYQYSLMVLYSDSTIVVNSKSEYGKVMQLPLLDSIFREAHVDSMAVTVVNDSTHQLAIFFKPESGYAQYSINYDKNEYLIRSMQYYLKNQYINDEYNGTVLISLSMNNYSEAPINQEIFKEDRFIYKLNGDFFGKGPFEGFKIINNTPEARQQTYYPN